MNASSQSNTKKPLANPAKSIWLAARYQTKSATCGHSISVGEVFTFVPVTKAKFCNACSHARERAERQAKLRAILLQPDLFELV